MPSSACTVAAPVRPPFPTRRSSDLCEDRVGATRVVLDDAQRNVAGQRAVADRERPELHHAERRRRHATARGERLETPVHACHAPAPRSEEHTSELQSLTNLVCRLLLVLSPLLSAPLSLHDALPISARIASGPPASCSTTPSEM